MNPNQRANHALRKSVLLLVLLFGALASADDKNKKSPTPAPTPTPTPRPSPSAAAKVSTPRDTRSLGSGTDHGSTHGTGSTSWDLLSVEAGFELFDATSGGSVDSYSCSIN